MVLFFVAITTSSWYFEIFAEKFLDDTAKAKRQNKTLLKLPHQQWRYPWTPATSLLSLLFPLPNLPRTLKKSRCIAISVHTSKDTATLQNLFATCPATSVLPHLAPANWGALEMGCIPARQGTASPVALALCSTVLEGSARTRLSKPQHVLYPDATSISFYCKTPTPSSASSLRNHKHPLEIVSNFNLIQAIGRQTFTQMLVWRWLWCWWIFLCITRSLMNGEKMQLKQS